MAKKGQLLRASLEELKASPFDFMGGRGEGIWEVLENLVGARIARLINKADTCIFKSKSGA